MDWNSFRPDKLDSRRDVALTAVNFFSLIYDHQLVVKSHLAVRDFAPIELQRRCAGLSLNVLPRYGIAANPLDFFRHFSRR
jgi:hypothetical protein